MWAEWSQGPHSHWLRCSALDAAILEMQRQRALHVAGYSIPRAWSRTSARNQEAQEFHAASACICARFAERNAAHWGLAISDQISQDAPAGSLHKPPTGAQDA
jgi:hypothetical protein